MISCSDAVVKYEYQQKDTFWYSPIYNNNTHLLVIKTVTDSKPF